MSTAMSCSRSMGRPTTRSAGRPSAPAAETHRGLVGVEEAGGGLDTYWRRVTMALLGLALVVLGYGSYLAMLFLLRRFTYRTRLFDAVVIVGTVLALVGLVTGTEGRPAWIAIVLGLAWYPVTRRELTLVGSERLTLRAGDRLPSFTAARADGTPITDEDIVARAPA